MASRAFTRPRPAAALAGRLEEARRPRGHGAHGALESTREAEHHGHRIVIRTRYTVHVDGQPFTGHLAVDQDGRVTCHALPTYTFTSAVDLVKKLIDAFPADFPVRSGRRGGRRWR